ncbi:MAG: hypothetical protein GEV07_16920 [Streptosporangiales bacterium]|nr:hypothetical protein [Streptosporangiales bacterium]
MSQRSDPDIPCGQMAMFTYRADATAKALGLDPTRWVYPCGLCNGAPVSEPGKLCATCAPTPPRTRRKAAAKKAAKKTTTTKGGDPR